MYIKFVFPVCVFLFISSCSSIHQYRKSTIIDVEGDYVLVKNDKLNFQSKTYGDFKFYSQSAVIKKLNFPNNTKKRH